MSNVASKVYLIHRREQFRVDEEIQQQVKSDPKIELILNMVVTKINGRKDKNQVGSIELKGIEGKKSILEISALFPCIGLLPYTDFLHELNVCDKKKYISVNEKCATKIPGLFAAGDVTQPERIRQIVTATSDGAIAAQAVAEYLRKIK